MADAAEVRGEVQDDGTVLIRTVGDLPTWDVLMNGPGERLADGPLARDVLVLGLARAGGPADARVLCDIAAYRTQRYFAVISRIARHPERAKLVSPVMVADQSLLDVLVSQWNARQTESNNDRHNDAYNTWRDIIEEAHERHASDVHLFATDGRTQFYFRIHGELVPREVNLTQEQGLNLARAMYNTMRDRGSTKGQLDLRVSQSAPVTVKLRSGLVRLRFESVPVVGGLNIALRLIDLDATIDPVDNTALGYSPDQSLLIDRMFAHSSGIILFLGPTGSGKSTSMANSLTRLVAKHPTKLLRTLEEPVEIRIRHASQTELVRDDAAQSRRGSVSKSESFAMALSAQMRADPDYIMEGEVRDERTADLAVQIARTGHLCVTTLHADGAPMGVDRLAGLGVRRSDLASVGMLLGMIFQRLVPTPCPHCRLPGTEAAHDSALAGVIARLRRYTEHERSDVADPLKVVYFRRPGGCDACHHTGIAGRTACAEVLVPNLDALNAIRAGDSVALWKAWRATISPSDPSDMTGRTAFEHGLWKMLEGVVSPSDVEETFRPLDEPVLA